MYTNHTPLSVAEYWRWWVVHLWVEGFFEVFATVAIAYLCNELGFLKRTSALRATYLTTILYLGSGVIGTLHHLYFSGTPVFITAMGAVASALEVVPLALIGFEVVKSMHLSQEAQGFYRLPLKFFIATCVWNLIGAGVFGFLSNPPIVLYDSPGLNTTLIHAHSALYGVYGSLVIALMLFTLREITPSARLKSCGIDRLRAANLDRSLAAPSLKYTSVSGEPGRTALGPSRPLGEPARAWRLSQPRR